MLLYVSRLGYIISSTGTSGNLTKAVNTEISDDTRLSKNEIVDKIENETTDLIGMKRTIEADLKNIQTINKSVDSLINNEDNNKDRSKDKDSNEASNEKQLTKKHGNSILQNSIDKNLENTKAHKNDFDFTNKDKSLVEIENIDDIINTSTNDDESIVDENEVAQKIKSGNFITSDFSKSPASNKITMANPITEMPALSKYLLDENRQLRNKPRIRNYRDNIEEKQHKKRLDKIRSFDTRFLPREDFYNREAYIVSESDSNSYKFPDIEKFERIQSFNINKFQEIPDILDRKKIRVPKLNVDTRSGFNRKAPSFFKSNIDYNKHDMMSGFNEQHDISGAVLDIKQQSNVENLKNDNDKKNTINSESASKHNPTKQDIINNKKQSNIDTENSDFTQTEKKIEKQIEEKINVAKQESKQEELNKKITDAYMFNKTNKKPVSLPSLPTTLETPEISKNLFDNNTNTATEKSEKESGLNNKLIIEQINESEKQMQEMEDLLKNVKVHLSKLKEELLIKRDDQRNIELNIIEVKEKNINTTEGELPKK
ncbi:hypothetical protein CDIK_0330 [Cucumispora dikerogammari]|nr:hypothetical protein CDIK_0330 [Cucumispora dikerogammari]